MTTVSTKTKTQKDVLDAAATRTRLELMLNRSFDPESLGAHRLHPAETARFIADQTRKLRLAAMQSGHSALVWMIEGVYYEAYTMGCKKQGLESEPTARRA